MIPGLFSEEAEVWILSGMLSGGNSYLDDHLTKLQESHFYSRNHKILFNAIVDISNAGCPVDSVTVSNKLKDIGKSDEIGGDYFVHKISVAAPTTAHADHWIKVLDDKRLMRESIDVLNKAIDGIGRCDDVNAYISDLESKILNLRKVDSSDNMLISATASALARNEKLLQGIKTFGIETGIRPIDQTLGGLGASQLFYVCARAGKGKTALLEQMFDKILGQDKPILVFQRDMAIDMMIERMACRNAGVSYFNYRLGQGSRDQKLLVKHELEKLGRLKDKLIIQSPFRLTAQDILSIVRREKSKHGVECVFLDHIQNIDLPEKEFREGLTRASSTLRRSAQDSGLPHVIIAQLNREAQEGRPKASHVKEFDGAYADCDAMVMLWSEMSQTDLSPGEFLPVKFLFVKNRYGPETEEEMYFDGNLLKFKERR